MTERTKDNSSTPTTDHCSPPTRQLLVKALDAITDNAIIGLNLEGKILVWNEGAHRLYGYSPEETIGKTVPLSGHDTSETDRITALNLTSILPGSSPGTSWEGTFTQTHKSGAHFEARVVITPWRDEHGQSQGLMLVARPVQREGGVANRSVTEQADPGMSENWYRVLFHTNPMPMWVFDLDNLAFLEVNDAAVQHYGYSRDEFFAMTILDIRPPDDIPRILEMVAQVKSGFVKQGIWRHQKKDGTPIEMDIHSRNLAFEGHQACLVLANDVTLRRQILKSRLENETRLRLIFENMPANIWTMDTDLRFISSEGAPAGSDGLKPETRVGRSLTEVLGEMDFAETILDAHLRALQGATVSYQAGRLGAFYHAHVQPMRDSAGNITGCIGVSLDVTEQVKAEIKLQKYAARLEVIRAIDEAILQSHSLEDIAWAALDRVSDLFDCFGASLAFIELEASPSIYATSRRDNSVERAHTMVTSQIDDEMLRELYAAPQDGPYLIVEDLNSFTSASRWRARMAYLGMNSAVILPLRSAEKTLGILTVFDRRPGIFSNEQAQTLCEVSNSLTVAALQIKLFAQVSETRDHLQILARQLVKVQEDERRHLANELHDQVGQTLTALNINLALIAEHLPARTSAKVFARIADSVSLVHQIIERTRDVMGELRPVVLDDYGLWAGIRWYAGLVSNRTGLNIAIKGEEAIPRLSPEIETALFRIAQEAITNVVKHARATHAEILLETTESLVRLSVSDNGVGFNPDQVQPGGGRVRIGLSGMRERAESVNSTLRVEAQPGQGSRIVVEVAR